MNTNHSYDVIVVGAGPGGSTAARHLARAGLGTLLIEKYKMPRYKPCGGGLTAKIRDVLDIDFSPTIEDTIQYGSYSDGTSRRYTLNFGPTLGWCVMRTRFDQLLAEHAADAGADLREGCTVDRVELDEKQVAVHVGQETYRAQVIVGADGANGLVARTAGLQRHERVGVALEAELQVSDQSLEIWRGTWHADFGAAEGGYGWIFPKADHLSVGVATLIFPERHQNLRRRLDRFIEQEPSLQGAKTLLLRGAKVPIGGVSPRVHRPRLVLVGDAAGVADPFTGEGIYQAIKSANLAAQEITAAFTRGDFSFENYTRKIQASFTKDYRDAWRVAQLVYRIPRFALKVFQRSTRLQAVMLRVATESKMTYRQSILSGLSPLSR